MHNLDRVLTQQEMYNEASFPDTEYESGFNTEYLGETSDEYSGEFNEAELAAELLSVNSEAELDQFFGKLFKTVARGVGSIARSPVGKIIGSALKQAAKSALPTLGAALGSAIPIPGVGTALGGMAGKALANALEMETTGMSMEDREYEMAQGVVKLAANAARQAANAPAGTNPAAIASQAIRAAINTLGPAGSAAGNYRGPQRRQSGRWIRRGNSVLVIGV